MKTIRILSVFFILFLLSCSKPDSPIHSPKSSEYTPFVHSFTSGLISSEGQIRVTLQDAPSVRPDRGNRFSFSPKVSGSEHWIDDRTIAFTPSSPLKPGAEYKVDFSLSDVVTVPSHLQKLTFGFSVMQQDMEIRIDDISIDDEGEYVISGTIFTADVAQKEDIQKSLKAEIDGKIGLIRWMESTDRRRHAFLISGISRATFDTMLKMQWNGSSIGVQSTGVREIPVPATGTFTLLQSSVIHEENPHIELTFSDRLDQRQRLDGLIRLGTDDRLNTIIQGNKIRVFFSADTEETSTLHIERGIKSVGGRTLASGHQEQIRLQTIKPNVRLTGRGVIIPTTGSMLVPFEAVGLGAVDVRIVQIFESNIQQFLQINDLSGDEEIRRVGKPVVSATVPLTTLGTFDPNRWTSFALDVSPLMEAEPGAIYRVTIGYRPHHRAISCTGETTPTSFTELEPGHWLLSAQEEAEWWDNYEYFWWHSDYSWRDRENPCTVSYYTRNQWINRNVLASDLGIIAKASENGEMDVFVTDINTVASRSGVDIEVFNFQRQSIYKGETGSNGHVRVSLPEEASLLVANDGNSKGYLRLESGRALSLSTFDVSGARVDKGLKGFLYGERGVWRPGDSLFVSLIIDDKVGQLPAQHPVQFELRNPMGQLIDRRIASSGTNGFFTYQTKTEASAPTGIWSITAHVGGVQFSRNLRIETIRPNRLDIRLDLTDETLTASNRNLRGNIVSKWLHGAPASNLKTDISLNLNQAPTQFSGFQGFVFDDVTRSFSAESETIFEGTLNEDGITDFNHVLPNTSDAPGKIRGTLITRVFEQSGNFSTKRDAFEYYPYPVFVGMQLPEPNRNTGGLDRNQSHDLQLVTVDSNGKAVSRKNLHITIYEMGWQWWWQQPGDGSGLYFSTESMEQIARFSANTGRDGKGVASFTLGDIYGRILIRVEDPESGHASSDVAYVGYSWRDDDSSGEGPARLAIRTDREQYSTGENAVVRFPSSAGSRALVSLETGTQILRTFWVDTQAGETSVILETKPEMSPNVYAHVMLIQPHAQMTNDLPNRLYGVVPILVENPESRLKPVLTVPSETKPNERLTIEIGEENGRAMTYTLAVVDEGLLSLTNFRTPDPHGHFFAREALGIKTWDMFDMISGPFTGSMSRILAIGGDREAGEISREPEANRFPPVVKFIGPFHLDARKKATHHIDIPNYVGAVRVMAVVGYKGAFGNASAQVPVRQSLMAIATLPRVLGPGEEVDVPVSLFTGAETSGRVEVNIQSSGLISAADATKQFVQMNRNDQQMAVFRLRTEKATGIASVSTLASLGSERASDQIEIEIRNPNPPVTNVYQQMIQPGESLTLRPEITGVAGSNRLTLELSTIAPLDIERRMRYLIRYPHGCLEQVVSSVFPQLYLSDFIELDDKQAMESELHINQAIRGIAAFQGPDGSLSYWPGRSGINEWTNVYAFHFLVEAGKKGYLIPESLKTGLERSLRAKSLSWRTSTNHSDMLVQSYRLYALALNGSPEAGAMNRLREMDNLPVAARWRLAAAYQLAGQPEAAIAVTSRTTQQVEQNADRTETFGSPFRDQALILESLSLMDRRMEAVQLASQLSEELASESWLSTQETAFALIAMAQYLKGLDISDELRADFVYGRESGSVNSKLPISAIDLEPASNEVLQIKNNSDGVLYARLISTGSPSEGTGIPGSNQLSISVKYKTMDGEEISPERLLQGTDVVIETIVTHPGTAPRYTEMALTHIMPSGWEIHNARLDDAEFAQPSSSHTYQDVRDDRVLTYFNLSPGESKIFRTHVNASYNGTFYLPSVKSYAMYDESIFAETAGKWVEVVRE